LSGPSIYMSNHLDNPCFECGQCCQKLRVSFYHGEVLRDQGGELIGAVPPDLVTQITPHMVCMKGTETGKQGCIALHHDDQQGYRCTIYEQRPSPCREFNTLNDDGSINPLCDKLRKAVGLTGVRTN
jgi:Fe-S-cluster containining protein